MTELISFLKFVAILLFLSNCVKYICRVLVAKYLSQTPEDLDLEENGQSKGVVELLKRIRHYS